MNFNETTVECENKSDSPRFHAILYAYSLSQNLQCMPGCLSLPEQHGTIGEMHKADRLYGRVMNKTWFDTKYSLKKETKMNWFLSGDNGESSEYQNFSGCGFI